MASTNHLNGVRGTASMCQPEFLSAYAKKPERTAKVPAEKLALRIPSVRAPITLSR